MEASRFNTYTATLRPLDIRQKVLLGVIRVFGRGLITGSEWAQAFQTLIPRSHGMSPTAYARRADKTGTVVLASKIEIRSVISVLAIGGRFYSRLRLVNTV